MTLMKFEYGSETLQFTVGGSYPSTQPTRIYGAQDRTAAGTLQYEELGIVTRARVVVFNLMPLADYEALLDWFVNIAEAGKNAFTFTDEYGAVGEVVFTNQTIDFAETSLNRFNGQISLEYLTGPT